MPTLYAGTNPENKITPFSVEHYKENFLQFKTDVERDDFDEVFDVIDEDDEEDIKKFSEEKLGKYNPEFVFKIVENTYTISDAFKILCENQSDGFRIFTKNHHDLTDAELTDAQQAFAKLPHAEAWSKRLKEGERPYFELVALNGEDVCTIYDFFVSVAIEHHLNKELDKGPEKWDVIARTYWLEEGIKHKSSVALRTKCKDIIAEIKNIFEAKSVQPEEKHQQETSENINLFSLANKTSEKLKRCQEELDKVLDLLSNLYMTMGHFYASNKYLDLGHYFAESEETRGIALSFFESAAKKFFGGECLVTMFEENKTNGKDYNHLNDDRELLNIFSYGEGLAAYGIKSWDDARNSILKNLPAPNVTQMRKEARASIEEGLAKREKKINEITTPIFSIGHSR